jgi:chloride channel protein, CIC family
MVLVAVGCGVAGAAGAILFRFLIRFFQAFFFESPAAVVDVIRAGLFVDPTDPLRLARELPWWLCVAIPAIGGLVVGPLIHFLAREAKGHGVPEVMEAVSLRGGVMRKRTAAVKILGSAITIGSGGSTGREGPIIQIGAVMGSAIGQWLRVPARQLRTIVGAGAAAGIAATFNAPIAGAIFAVEVIVGDFAVAQFSPIVIASVVATVISRYFLGNYPSFAVPDWELVSPFELVPYMAMGVVSGLVGVAFIRTLYGCEDLFERSPIPEWMQPAVGGLLVGGIGYLAPNVFGVGYETIGLALEGKLTAAFLGVLLVAKLLATSITLGSGGSGGVFTPSLFLGVTTGGIIGHFVHGWFPDATATSGAYALVAMGAVVAATTHAPIMAILMLFEMTQSVTIIPPLMAACVVSTIVSMLFQRDSIFTLKLRQRGIEPFAQEDPNVLKTLYVRDVLDDKPEIVPASARFEKLIGLLVESAHTEFFVVDARERLLGAISLAELRRVVLDREHLRSVVVAGDLVEIGRGVVTTDDDLDVVMQILDRDNVDEVAVVEEKDRRRIVGSVHKRDVIHAFNAELLRRDLAGGIAKGVGSVERTGEFSVGEDFLVRDVPVSHRLAGKTLGELDLRARTGALVLLIRRPGAPRVGASARIPSAEDHLQDGDVLIAAGSREALEQLERL